MHEKCVLECEEFKYIEPSTYTVSGKTLYYCLGYCPISYPYVKAEDDMTCVDNCASGFYKVVYGVKVCVDVCDKDDP